MQAPQSQGPAVAAVIFGHEVIPNGETPARKAEAAKKLVAAMARDIRSQRVVLALAYGTVLQMIMYISLYSFLAYSEETTDDVKNIDTEEKDPVESSVGVGVVRFVVYLVKTVLVTVLRLFVGPFFNISFIGIAFGSALCSAVIGFRMQAQEYRCPSLKSYCASWLSFRLWLEAFTFGGCASFMANCYAHMLNWEIKNLTFLAKGLDENQNYSDDLLVFLNDSHVYLHLLVFAIGVYTYAEWCRGSRGGFTLKFPTVPLQQAEVIRNNIIELFPKALAEMVSLMPFVYFGVYIINWLMVKPTFRFLGYSIDPNNEVGLFTVGMWFKAGFFSFLISYLFQLLYTVVQAIMTEELDLSLGSQVTTNPYQFLLTDAMNCKDTYLQHLGFHTFKMSANPFRPGVAQFYELSHPGSHPRNWTTICTATLQACDNLSRELREFIKPKVSTTNKETNRKPPSAYLLTCKVPGNRFGQNSQDPGASISPIRSLAATQGQRQTEGQFEENSASYFMTSVMSPVNITRNIISNLKAAVMKKFQWVSELRKSWENPRPELAMSNIISGFQLVLWGVNGLVEVICMSTKLDKHGIVQRDMSKVIHKFVDVYQVCIEILSDGRLSSDSVAKIELISQATFYAISKIHVRFGKHYEMLRVDKEYQIFVADIVKMDTQETND